jgi:hypothetical protein
MSRPLGPIGLNWQPNSTGRQGLELIDHAVSDCVWQMRLSHQQEEVFVVVNAQGLHGLCITDTAK